MYQCIGVFKNGWFTASAKGCGEKWSDDTDRCPKCNGFLIPESMVNDNHRENMIQRTNEVKQSQTHRNLIDEVSFQTVINFLKQNQYDYEMRENDDSVKKVITWLLKAQ
ncbi:hypothetical protein NST33_18030 [Paenibacillus sp. FSL L8-0435]|uniref:hypothetical protein n=1 Tax=Paenibacillus sp. FSL L8-0435 TaxID=2954618 RepID=UPI0030DC0B22